MLLEQILPEQQAIEAFDVEHYFGHIGRKIIRLKA
jgi:hypothetical protein